SDLRARKLTMPVVAALNSGTPEAGRLAELYARPDPSEEELEEAAALVEAAGGRAWAESEADERVRRAAEHLRTAKLPEPVRADFLTIADFVAARDHCEPRTPMTTVEPGSDTQISAAPSSTAPSSAARTAAEALEAARDHLLGLQSPEGWWKGELQTNVTMDAE